MNTKNSGMTAVSFDAANFHLPKCKPTRLVECWGPVGLDGPLADLRSRFGEWRKTAIGGVWGIHDRGSLGFTYREKDDDLAEYRGLSFDEFKAAFIQKDVQALGVAYVIAQYPGSGGDSYKYLGLRILEILRGE